MLSLEQKLEAVLFHKGEPEKRRVLEKVLGVSGEELDAAAHLLFSSLATRGIRLLMVQDELELVTAPECSELIAALKKSELTRDLGKAGAETLAIVLYRGPLTRAHLDYVRGVNSSFIVRNLEVRGLIERVPNPDNTRQTLLAATPLLLKHLGVTTPEELPDHGTILAELAAFETSKEEPDTTAVAQPIDEAILSTTP